MKNYYLLLISIVFICGVFLAAFSVFTSFSSNFLAIITVILFILLALSIKIKKDFLFIAILFCLVFFLGVIRYNDFNSIRKYNIKNYLFRSPDDVLVKGMVKADPSIRERKIVFRLEADSIKQENKWKPATGFVLVSMYRKDAPVFYYGDIVILEGRLASPFSYREQSRFDYREYLASKRIYSTLNVKKGLLAKKINEDKKITTQIIRTIYSIRTKLESHIKRFLEEPYDSLVCAILLGKRREIPSWLGDLFAKTGTLHILAISGLHVGIIYFALKTVLKIARIPTNSSIILCVLFLVCYTILAGGRPSILRAAVMFSILAFGEILKRKISVFNLIGLSCLIVLMANPNQIFDLGFIFSYGAVLSIVSLSPIFYKVFSVKDALSRRSTLKKRVKYYMLKSVSVSLAAWIGLMPLIAHYFGLVSPIVVIANLVVVPLVFMIMGSGLLFISFGFLSGFLATLFSQSTWFFLFLLINSVKFLKSIPFSYFRIEPVHISAVIVYYTLLLTIFWSVKRKNQLFYF